jgi:glycosyltransferase involved in cell wall biosynthesis
MKILIVAPRYYPHVGGVEYVVKSIAESLEKLGHEITVLVGEPNNKKRLEEYVNGAYVIRWPTLAPSDAYHIPKRRDQLRSLLRKLLNDIDVVHIHSAHAVLTVWAAAAAPSPSLPASAAAYEIAAANIAAALLNLGLQQYTLRFVRTEGERP